MISALATAVIPVLLLAYHPAAAARGIWHAGAFREEMVRWIATGASE
ncbi:MAG TPA: hypothetical protein VK123_06085 [Candidatus Limnocylindrales bacterium]|nr:hypothetical protein [Candidatus Limnocylindrales bacterium]